MAKRNHEDKEPSTPSLEQAALRTPTTCRKLHFSPPAFSLFSPGNLIFSLPSTRTSSFTKKLTVEKSIDKHYGYIPSIQMEK